jgi:DNA-binding response OmpR family regulator
VSALAGRLLVVDDDEDVRHMVARSLQADGYDVEQAGDASAAVAALERSQPDLVVLDIMLAGDDGLELLGRIRRTNDIPVILLTGRAHENDRILGLKLGADDYVVKPFSPGELAARVTSVLRRSRPKTSDDVLDFGPLTINVVTREVQVQGALVDTTAKEFDLLAFLARSPRQVFTRDQLLEQVWESSSAWQDSATVTEHVRRLRRKVEGNPDQPRWLKTVRGVGYRFEP